MELLLSLLVAVAAAVYALSLPASDLRGSELALLSKRAGTPSSQGYTPDGSSFWYSWWTDKVSNTEFTLGPGKGTFTLNWSGNVDIVGGIGWNPGYNGR